MSFCNYLLYFYFSIHCTVFDSPCPCQQEEVEAEEVEEGVLKD